MCRIDHRDFDQRFLEGGITEGDMRQARVTTRLEESVEKRTPQIEVDEHNTLAPARKRDRKIRRGCRFALCLDGASDHDDLRLLVQPDEVKIRSKHPKRLSL